MTKRISFPAILKGMAMLLLVAITFTACDKDNDDVNNPAVEGMYVGKYGFDNNVPVTDFKFEVAPGGVFREIGVNTDVPAGQGTWELNGNTLTAHYTMLFAPYSEYSISATFNEATSKLTGTWGFDNDPDNGGLIDMTRQ